MIFLATATLSATKFLYPVSEIQTSFDTEDPNLAGGFEEPVINWNEINLVGSAVLSPEDEVQIARSKMLRGFEAR